MNGLKFSLDLYQIEYKDFADSLGLTKSNVTMWANGTRKIPKKHLIKIQEAFPNVPVEYFQKELTDLEKLEIKKIEYFSWSANDPIAQATFEKEMKRLTRVEEEGKEIFDGSKVIYEITKDIDKATHWIAYENYKYHDQEETESFTENKIYKLYIDKFTDEIVIFDNFHRTIFYLEAKGDYIIVDSLHGVMSGF